MRVYLDDTRKIEYLRYFIEYLDDSTLKDFLAITFDIQTFSIEPFNNYKDFFLYLFTKDVIKKVHINPNKLIDRCGNEIKIHNSLTLINNYEDKIIQNVNFIGKTIDNFVNLNLSNNNDDFKKFFKYVTKDIINKRYCYIIEAINDTEYYIIKIKITSTNNKFDRSTFNIIKQDNKYIFSNNHSKNSIDINNISELYDKFGGLDFKCYKQLNRTIDKLAVKLINKNNTITYCHICNSPIFDNKKQKCENCKNIYKLIKDIDPNFSTNDIGNRIKRKYVEEKNLSAKKKKSRHYKNLKDFVKKLEKKLKHNKLLTNVNTEKINRLKDLIDSTFGIIEMDI